MAIYWENSCSFGLRYVSWYKCLVVGLVFSHLGFWSGNLFLIAPFPDLCLLLPLSSLSDETTVYKPKPRLDMTLSVRGTLNSKSCNQLHQAILRLYHFSNPQGLLAISLHFPISNLFISEFLWLRRVATLKRLPVHPFNTLIFPILRDCLQSVCIFLSLNRFKPPINLYY